jgi:DNA-binding beta-propeller fold protein YncE
VIPDRELDVFQTRPPFRLVERVRVPAFHAMRGVAVDARRAIVYASVGGNGGSRGNGAVVAYDLRGNRVLWRHAYDTGTDGLAITPDGRRLFVPVGEHTMSDVWHVVSARDGRVVADLHAAPGPHNTIVSRDGRLVYLGPRNSRFLVVASTRTLHVVRRVGPLLPGVRPFTVDERRGIAYTTATGVLGFQVSSLRTGRVLHTVRIRGFPPGHRLGAPSHGIAITPDGRRVAVIDVPSSYVHVYAVTGAPRLVKNIRLDHSMRGTEHPCGGDCGRAGWLQVSLDGRYLWVGDDGDVIDLRTLRPVAWLPALSNSRYLFELDWRGDRPLRTGGRSGVG